jgi:hypothetical protein
MLESDYQQKLNALARAAPCQVQIPRAMRRLFEERRPIEVRPDERRRFVRFSSRAKLLLEVKTTIKGIERKPEFFTVLTTDLSRDGVAFLHAAQLFPGEVPRLWFRTGVVPCRVVRCVRHAEKCYEVGATFETGPQSSTWLREASTEILRELAGTDTAVHSSPILPPVPRRT